MIVAQITSPLLTSLGISPRDHLDAQFAQLIGSLNDGSMALLVPFQRRRLLMASSIPVFSARRRQLDEPTLVHAQQHDTGPHRFKFAIGSTPINGLTHAPRDVRPSCFAVRGDDLPDFL
jgi:hypothetical protein